MRTSMMRDYDSTGQLTLDAVQDMHTPAKRLARRTDPATSKAAALGNRETHLFRILAVFAARPNGVDYMTAARLADLPPWEVTRRVSDLSNKGLIAAKLNADGTEATVKLPSNRAGRVYVITALGAAAIEDAA